MYRLTRLLERCEARRPAGVLWTRWTRASCLFIFFITDNSFIFCPRFLQSSGSEITSELEKQNADYATELDALSKKREWIERQISELNGTLRDVMRSTGKA
jgi:hypothetical protein